MSLISLTKLIMRLGYPIFIIEDHKSKRIPSLGKPILRLCSCPILRLGNMGDSKFGLPKLKIGTQTWNSKFGLPNLKIEQIPSLSTTDIPTGSNAAVLDHRSNTWTF